MNKYKYAIQKGYYVAENGDAYSCHKKLKLKLSSKICRYYCFNIRYYEKHTTIKVHRLQAYQKFGEAIFEKGIVVRHLNGDSLDNSFNNIDIGTQSDNVMDMPLKVRVAKAIRATSFVKKFNHNSVFLYYQKTQSYKKTMAKFGIKSKGTLYNIIKKFSKS